MLMYEALMHMLLDRLHERSQLSALTVSSIAILRDPTTNSQETLASAHKELEADSGLDTLVGCMFQKTEKSDMACYWLQFMTMVEILMLNKNAVHTCSWDEYLISLREMMPWMIIYDQNNYGRWLPHFWAMLTSLPPD